MTQITLDLPEATWERTRARAERTGCSVEALIADELTQANAVSRGLWAEDLDLSALSDAQLLIHIHAMVPPAMQDRLTDFQERNGEGELSQSELEEFERLLYQAHVGNLLKARALIEWAKRHGSLPDGIDASR